MQGNRGEGDLPVAPAAECILTQLDCYIQCIYHVMEQRSVMIASLPVEIQFHQETLASIE